MKEYKINEYYKIKPFIYKGSKVYNAKFVGYAYIDQSFSKKIKLKDFPIFYYECYTYGDNKMGYEILYNGNGEHICRASNMEDLLREFHRKILFRGEGYQKIMVGSRELTRDEFIKEARETSLTESEINESLETGKYYTKNNRGGEIKICPTCKVLRDTTCCACGCGNCKVCGYRWTCMPVNFNFEKMNIIPIKYP